MPSPFPGMDPYVERYWREIHHGLCTYARDALQPQVRPKLQARLDERLVVESDDLDEPRTIIPDVRVEVSRGGEAIGAGGMAVAENEPMVVRFLASEPAHEAFVQIIDPADGNRLVTVIEFLSPSNKRPGLGRRQYLAKQAELRDARVSLVEIDLVRAGAWSLLVPRRSIPTKRRATYNICVHRGWLDDVCEVYAVRVNRALPKVRIPLRKGDADAQLDLQALFNQAYDNGPYADSIDYAGDADPPLTGDAAAWADELLRQAGRRPGPT